MADHDGRTFAELIGGDFHHRTQVIHHVLEVTDERSLPVTLAVADMVRGVDRTPRRGEPLRQVSVPPSMLRVAVNQHNNPLAPLRRLPLSVENLTFTSIKCCARHSSLLYTELRYLATKNPVLEEVGSAWTPMV